MSGQQTEIAKRPFPSLDPVPTAVREDGRPYDVVLPDDSTRKKFTKKRHEMPLVGTVGAGPGVLTTFEPARSFFLRPSLAL